MRLLPLLVLAACGNPISNQLLYEDEVFLAALPSVARVAPPEQVRFARVGTSGLLQDAVEEAAALEDLAAVIGATGEALRSAPADERSEVVRRWNKVSTAARLDGESRTWFVRGEVLQPVEDGVLDWTLEASADGREPWIEVGVGAHDPEGAGQFTWALTDHAALIGVGAPEQAELQLEYTDPTEKEPRELLIEDGDVEFGGSWRVLGENVLVWFGTVVIVKGEDPAPGAAQVFHDPAIGGRGTGGLVTAEGEVPFDICWDANGNDVFATGGGLPEVGSESDCSFSF